MEWCSLRERVLKGDIACSRVLPLMLVLVGSRVHSELLQSMLLCWYTLPVHVHTCVVLSPSRAIVAVV